MSSLPVRRPTVIDARVVSVATRVVRFSRDRWPMVAVAGIVAVSQLVLVVLR